MLVLNVALLSPSSIAGVCKVGICKRERERERARERKPLFWARNGDVNEAWDTLFLFDLIFFD
jgi:hypothetical protein